MAIGAVALSVEPSGEAPAPTELDGPVGEVTDEPSRLQAIASARLARREVDTIERRYIDISS